MSPLINIDALARQALAFDISQRMRSWLLESLNEYCRGGWLAAVQLLTKTIRVTPAEVRAAGVFETASRNDHLELAMWLVETYQLTKVDAIGAFIEACWGASLDTARWQAEHFQLPKGDLVSAGEDCPTFLKRACEAGNLEHAKWVVEIFRPTSDDFRKDCHDYNIALRRAFHGGHLEIVRWLVTSFSFQRDDAIQSFYTACRAGELDICKYLAEYYQINPGEVREENRAQKECQHSWVTGWLVDTYYKASTNN